MVDMYICFRKGLVGEADKRNGNHVSEGDLVHIHVYGEYRTTTSVEKKLCTEWFGYVKSVRFNDIPVDKLCRASKELGK